MDCPVQMGLYPNHQLTEDIIHESHLPESIGGRWRDLARALTFNQAAIETIEKDKGSCIKECCIEVLYRWMGRKGRDATIGKLADALIKIELKNLADKLICLDANQNDKFQKIITDMQTNCKELEDEGCKMRLTIEDLNEKLSNSMQKCQEVERECSKLGARNLELQEDLFNERQQHQNTVQEGSEMRARIKQLEEQLKDSEQECSKLHNKILELEEDLASERQQRQRDNSQEGVSDATKDELVTDQATRERRISVQLKHINEKLGKYVIPLLQVPEVKEDTLKTAVKLDLLTKLSVSLQDMYSEIQAMAAETCKCNEDLKREFYDFAYHGLRAEHNDLLPRVKDLESSRAEMSDEEKKDFERLKQYQINRQRQVDRLENLWRGLFSSPEILPKASSSVPSKGGGNSEKASSRNYTDPGAKQKLVEPPPTSDDGVCLKFKQSAVKSLFTRKESKENTCFTVSYTHRDS